MTTETHSATTRKSPKKPTVNSNRSRSRSPSRNANSKSRSKSPSRILVANELNGKYWNSKI